MNNIRRQIFDILQIGDTTHKLSRTFDIFLVGVIFLNISAMILQTFREFHDYFGLLRGIEFWTTMIFLVEYILRIITADYLYPQYGKVGSRLRFLVSFDGVVNLLTIIPAFFLTGFIVFRMLRVVRIFHLFRINAQYDSFNVITSVLYERRNQLASSIFIILILMLASSLCMYSAEHEVQPDVFRNAFSGLWWAVSTILTVGYGDIYPITVLGRIMAILIAFLGVGAVAIPTGIISAGFVEQYTRNQEEVDYRTLDILDIAEVLVDEKLAGLSIPDVQKREGLRVYLVLRGGLSVLPTDELVLAAGDIIVVQTPKTHR